MEGARIVLFLMVEIGTEICIFGVVKSPVIMSQIPFQDAVAEGIPTSLPPKKQYDPSLNHAPKRRDVLTPEEKRLAIRNALRYIPAEHHSILAGEFA